MTIKDRILTAMTWGLPDRVPLTVYDWLLPRGQAERALREAGVGLIVRLPPHRVEHREVQIRTCEYFEHGQKRIRRTIHTPVGDAWETLVPDAAYGTSNWIQEYLVKAPADYRVLEYYYSIEYNMVISLPRTVRLGWGPSDRSRRPAARRYPESWGR